VSSRTDEHPLTLSPTPKAPSWQIDRDAARHVLSVAGDWIAQHGGIPVFPLRALDGLAGAPLCFDMSGIGTWDSALIGFLWDARLAAGMAHMPVDETGLPESARKLLGLLPDRMPAPAAPVRRRFQPLRRLGASTIGMLTETGVLALLLADTVQGGVAAVVGRARIRSVDLMGNISDAGPSALVIVSVVNFLIGAILAFVGAAQLRKFAADAYVANLVGLALVREMAAVMTAIVMAGRTGGAYAARIATMQGNEEIDALKVIGIPISDYILLPSILALVFTLPLLYLYGCLIGMIGGLVVASAMLNITVAGYIHQTLEAVPISQFIFGFLKSIAFAVLIGVTSCRTGLKAGRSAADVGLAATRAVVIGIVGVIAMDAVFAVIADAVGI
jgi:phospholipid/cholesterol/gamma-HCH transport system permease protein